MKVTKSDEHHQYLDSLAAEFLACITKENDSAVQIEMIRDAVFTPSIKQPLLFDSRLSQREAMCLFLAAAGKSTKETAKFLRIELSTVEYYRKEILRKLNCRSMAHAVYEGIKYGYLLPKEQEGT